MKIFTKKGKTAPDLSDARKTFQWPDEYKGENVIWKLPRNIQWNDNVIVKEDEWVVFFRDGKAMHVFHVPGRYALTTQNIPILATLATKATGVRQLGEIFWVQKRELRGKYGTLEPFAFRDPDFGVVRIRAFGQFAYKVEDPGLLITQFAGTMGYTSSAEILEWIKGEFIKGLNDVIGELKTKKGMGVLDMPAYLQEMEQLVLASVNSDTLRYGIRITKVSDINLNLPKEVEAAIDKRASMSALGVNYMQYQTGKAIEGVGTGAAKGGDSANFAGMGAGIGAGYAMGQAMVSGMGTQHPQSQPAPPLPTGGIRCPNCGYMNLPNAKFCMNCGAPLNVPRKCPNCGAEVPAGAKFCPNCGAKLE